MTGRRLSRREQQQQRWRSKSSTSLVPSKSIELSQGLYNAVSTTDLASRASVSAWASTGDMRRRRSSSSFFLNMKSLDKALDDDAVPPQKRMSSINVAARAAAVEMFRNEQAEETKARAKAIDMNMMAAQKRRSTSMVDLFDLDTSSRDTWTESTKELFREAKKTTAQENTNFSYVELMEHLEFFLSVATEKHNNTPRVPLKTCLELQKANDSRFPKNNIQRIIAGSKTPNIPSCSFKMLLPCWYPGIARTEILWMMKVAFPPTVEAPEPSAVVRRRMKALFDSWDTDGDGCISHPEMATALEGMGYTTSEIRTLFALSDQDSNQAVDFNEFDKLMGDFLSAA